MRLLIDMDGVTADLCTPWVQWINRTFPAFNDSLDRPDLQQQVRDAGVNPNAVGRFKVTDIKKWDTGAATGLGPAVYDFFKQDGVFADLEPFPDAVEVLKALHGDGHELHYVTASTAKGHEDKLAWVRKHTPFIPETRVNFVQEKHIVSGDIIFDDKPSTIEKALTERFFAPNYRPEPVIMDRPYNQVIQPLSGRLPFRVKNWQQFYGIIMARSKK